MSIADKLREANSPKFDLDHSKNVTAMLQKTGVLNCRVRNLGDRTVSSDGLCSFQALSYSYS